MKAGGLITLFTTLMLAVGISSSRAGTDIWVGGSGNWSVANNWNPHHVPGSSDIAIITNTGNYTVTLDAAIAVAGLTLGATNVGSTQILSFNGQTLTLGGQATVNSGGQFNLSSGTFIGKTNNSGGAVFNGILTCSGGALVGKLTMTTNSVLNLAGNSASNSLKGLILLTNYGTVNWSNTDLYGAAGQQIFNFSLWDAQTSNAFYGNGTNGTIFNNTGTFRKSAGGGISMLDSNITFNSTGMVDVESGTLAVQAGTCSGIFNTASGTILNFGYNPNLITFILTGNTTFTGNGIVEGVLISGSNALIGGNVTFSAATLYNTMTISNTGVVNFVGTLGTNIFGSITFNNYGVVNWSNTDLRVGRLGTMQINNYGLWDAKTNNTFYGTNSFNNSFNNYGTFRKSSGGGTTTLDSNLTFENIGTVDVQSGTLQIQYGYSPATGTFNIATSALVYFSGTSGYGFLSYGGTSFTGNGSILGNLTGSSGGSNVINGTITYLGGTLSGSLMVASNAVLNLPVGANFSIPSYANLANYGTVNWISGDLTGSIAEIYNYGLWDAKTNNTFYGQSGSPTTFNNYGTFRKSGGTGGGGLGSSTLLDYNMTFNNPGTVDVQSGTLDIEIGSGSGTFNTATNARTYLSACILMGNPVFTGDGTVDGGIGGSNAVLHGTINLNQSGFGGTLTIASNAVLNILANLDLSTILTNDGTVNWYAGQLLGESGAEIYNYGLWDAKVNNEFDTDTGYYGTGGATTFNNYGTFRKSGGTGGGGLGSSTLLDYNMTFNNPGTVEFQRGTLDIEIGSGSRTFKTATNARTYLSACILMGNPVFTGDGTVDGGIGGSNAVLHGTINLNQSGFGGTLTIASNAVLNILANLDLSTILTNDGTVNWYAGQLLGESGAEIYNYGLWDAKVNNEFDTDTGYYGTNGATTFNNYGTFRKSGASGGNTVLDNNTTFNNPGTLDVQTGLVNLGGSYSLAGGTLNFGLNSSNDFGSIELANIAALAGKLGINLNNGYSPAAGSSFALLSYGSETGTFNALNLPHLSGGLVWQTNYGTVAFTLSVSNPPPPKLSSMTLLNGGTISFGWNGVAGQTYQVQCTTNLAPANWINLGNSMPGTNGMMTASDVIGLDSQRFYRLVVQ